MSTTETSTTIVRRFIEIHIIKSEPANCKNRGFDDRPKYINYDGYDRARNSTASVKKPMRAELNNLPGIPASYNTARVADEILERLMSDARFSEEIRKHFDWISWAVAACLVSSKKPSAKPSMKPLPRHRQTVMAVNIADDEVQQLVEITTQNVDRFIPLAEKTSAAYDAISNIEEAEVDVAEPLVEPKDDKPKKPSKAEKEDKARKKAEKKFEEASLELFMEVMKYVKAFRRGTKAAAVLAFGRFLAKEQDAWQDDPALQISDPMGVNVMRMTPDHWTQIDELNEKHGDESERHQSNNLGTRWITSDVMYTYGAINNHMLVKGYNGDLGLVKTVVEALLWGLARASASGRQNTHAAYSIPSAILVTTHSNHQINLSSAFGRPVEPTEDLGLSSVACARLDDRWGFMLTGLKTNELPSAGALDSFIYCDDESASTLKNLADCRKGTIQDLFNAVMDSAGFETEAQAKAVEITAPLQSQHKNGKNGVVVGLTKVAVGK